MPINTFWLRSKPPVPGLDQVGIRSSSIRLYTHLVPGLTNVTDRARYFSAHSYAVDLWARQFATNDIVKFRRLFRRLECVLGIAEKIREHDGDARSSAIVGTDAIRRWLKQCPQPLPNNFKVPITALEEAYFGNKWGAFGQYYAGSELALRLVSRDGLPALISPLGPKLASAYKVAADSVHLLDLLSDDHPQVKDFRRIGSELSFSNITSDERSLLRQIFLDTTSERGHEGTRRRKTLLLLLSIAQESLAAVDDPAWTVLKVGLYGRSEKVSFTCPSPLLDHLELWRTYALHELFAFCVEVLLVACIEQVGRMELETLGPARSIAEVSRKLASLMPSSFARKPFGQLVGEGRATARMTAKDSPASKFGEISLRDEANDALKNQDLPAAIVSGLKLLARVAAHLEPDHSAYASFLPDTPLEPGRLSLDSLSRFAQISASSPVSDVAQHWITIAANTHLRVATAKLAHNNDFTYKIAFDGGRLRKIRETEPAFSSPRLWQAAQMLSDVGLLENSTEGYSIAPAGLETLRSYGCLS